MLQLFFKYKTRLVALFLAFILCFTLVARNTHKVEAVVPVVATAVVLGVCLAVAIGSGFVATKNLQYEILDEDSEFQNWWKKHVGAGTTLAEWAQGQIVSTGGGGGNDGFDPFKWNRYKHFMRSTGVIIFTSALMTYFKNGLTKTEDNSDGTQNLVYSNKADFYDCIDIYKRLYGKEMSDFYNTFNKNTSSPQYNVGYDYFITIVGTGGGYSSDTFEEHVAKCRKNFANSSFSRIRFLKFSTVDTNSTYTDTYDYYGFISSSYHYFIGAYRQTRSFKAGNTAVYYGTSIPVYQIPSNSIILGGDEEFKTFNGDEITSYSIDTDFIYNIDCSVYNGEGTSTTVPVKPNNIITNENYYTDNIENYYVTNSDIAEGELLPVNIPATPTDINTYTLTEPQQIFADGVTLYPNITEEVTEKPTEEVTEKPTEEVTEKPTEDVTSDNLENYKINGLTEKFPFCIPFDLYAFACVLNSEPVAININVPFNFGIIGTYTVSIDFAKYDKFAEMVRTFEILLFLAGLAMATRGLIRG